MIYTQVSAISLMLAGDQLKKVPGATCETKDNSVNVPEI